jgi:hypothetical protein
MSLKTGKYRHFKGGEYAVFGVAQHSETGEAMVVYSPLYGERGLWVRPLAMFQQTVEREGQILPRFDFVEALPQGVGLVEAPG